VKAVRGRLAAAEGEGGSARRAALTGLAAELEATRQDAPGGAFKLRALVRTLRRLERVTPSHPE
jgi:hypothetical protein